MSITENEINITRTRNSIMERHHCAPKNVLLIENPTILINATELTYNLGISKKECAIIITSITKVNISQIKKIIIEDEWHSVQYLADFSFSSKKETLSTTVIPTGIKGTFSLRRLLRAAAQSARDLSNIDRVVCGSYSNEISLHFIANLKKYQHYFLVDDGNMTLFTAKNRKNELAHNFSHVLGINSIATYKGISGALKKAYKRGVLGLHDHGIPKVNFFTCHSDISISENDSLAINCYKNLTKTEQSKKHLKENEVLFLGAPLLERKIVSPSSAEGFFNKIRERYNTKSILYVPHRMETEKTISIAIKTLQPTEVMRLDEPIEAYIARSTSLPKTISTFYSSAIKNILAMGVEGQEINSFKIESNLILDKDKRKLVDEIYGNLESNESEKLAIISLKYLPNPKT